MTLQISQGQLSLGMQGADVARVQQALEALGRSLPVGEVANRVLGAGTVAAVKALQTDLGVSASGIIDTATVKAINDKLATTPTDRRVVRGSVRRADGEPFVDRNTFVQIFVQGPAGEQVIGKSALNARDGSYDIAYQPPPDSGGRVDLRVAALSPAGPLETIPSGAAILTDAGSIEVVNFVVTGALNQPRSEFDLLLGDLKPLLGSRKLVDLTEDANRHDVSLLASQSIYASEQVAALALAHKLEKDTKTPAAVFYGLVRQGLPADVVALQEAHPDVRLEALRAAVAHGVVPAQINGKNIEEYQTGLAPAATEPLRGLLGKILNANELKLFVDRYQKSGQDPAAFWKAIAADRAFAARAAELKFTVQLGGLTNNHAPLVAAIRALPDIQQPSDLVRLDKGKWKSLIRTRGVGVPADTPGANVTEKTNTYVQQILRQVETAFPTPYFAERLGSSPVATFLKRQPSYDIKRTYPAQFFKDNPAPAMAPKDRQQLEAFQRLYRLTGSATETIALAGKHRSATDIARMDRTVFGDQHKDVLSAERAEEIHDRASRTSAVALALLGEHGAALNRTGMRVLPKLDVVRQAGATVAIPDWQTMFGTFNLCACRDCASVHGPAAYFVDILKFLGDRGVRDALFARRPDLGDIELSCENTVTVLPMIDLANEVLEDAVAPQPAFAPFALAAALESDLAEIVATAALSAAFAPPLQSGARVEVLESGKRWRVWDEAFAYSIVKDAGALTVAARSRQTTGPERRATPQYRNRAAYAELAQSVYPWNLPFDLPSEEANVFLRHLGAPRRDLIEALRPLPDPIDANAPVLVRLAAEGLGLTETERRILVGEPLTPPRQPVEFWGSAPLAVLGTVQEMLDRSGLDYAELDALIATWFVDPDDAVTISAKSGAPVDTCDTTLLQLNGLSEAVVDRLHRFVRLRRKLGWTIADLDRSLRAVAPNQNAPVLSNDILVRLDHLRMLRLRLRLSVAEALALWRSIDTNEPGSLYGRLFYNPSVFKPQDEAFRLRPDGQELVHADALLADHAAALQTAFRLTAASLAPLLAKTDGKLTLGNLSLIYRHAVLARQLRLAVDDLLIAIDLTGIDPFRVDGSQDTLRFVEIVDAVRGSGFRFPQLDYLLRHRFNPAAAFVPAEATLAQILLELRTALLAVDAASDAERQTLRQSAVIDRLSAVLGVSGDVTGALLERVTHEGESTLRRFLQLAAVTGDSLSRQNAKPQFETLEKLLKVATVIQSLRLTGSQLDWLLRENAWITTAPDPAAAPIPLADWLSLIELQHVRQDLALADAALEAILSAVGAVALSADPAARLVAKAAFMEALAEWLGWPHEDLQTLLGKPDDAADLGLLEARLPEDYRVHLIVRLNRAMGLLKRLGVSAAAASQWCQTEVSDGDAKAIRGATKARHDDRAWQTLAPTLQDPLRERQREALVGYLVARPEQWGNAERADADDLFAHFLIDVETCSCQLTSRIKQAIGSAQLFAQRCLLGLEPPLQTSDPKWAQWSWMKNYRVWEANRKIWLYPENWIEPELRDDKTPFFAELESELLQSDLDDTAAEQAVLHYLEKLDEVARLEIVGVYEDDDKVLHVFGRTLHAPHIHYYRRREGARWTPWEKVGLDIEGDHLIPVMWNRKLMLIWPVFNEKAKEKPVAMPEPNARLDSADRYWEIQLAWSEYQNGRWSGKNLSEPVTFTAYQGEDNILFGERVPASQNTTTMIRLRKNDGNLPDPSPIDPGDDDPGDPVPPRPDSSTAPRRLVSKELISFKALASGDSLVVRGFLRRDYRQAPATTDLQIAYPFGEFRFFGCRKIVTTAHNAQIARRNFALAPTGTKFDRMWFTETGPALTLFDGQFPAAPPFVQPTVFTLVNEPASIAGDPSSTLVNKFDIPVLDLTPWSFRLLAPHQDLQFVCDRPFFFMDGKRTFMAASTGTSGKTIDPLVDWIKADVAVAWRSDYFPAQTPVGGNGSATDGAGEAPSSLTVLIPGPRGQRLARELAPVSLKPAYKPKGLLPKFWTTREYRFENFHHPYLCEFIKTLNRDGMPGLISYESQNAADPQSFDVYRPEPRVLQDYPVDEVEFQSGRAYEVYNWELFFHIPLLIAVRLSMNQRFQDAQRWFHFIFDPTGASGEAIPQRYWRTKPFHDRLRSDYESQSVKTIEDMVAHGASAELNAAVEWWRSHPFSPHAVARLRTTAYQKTVVMKYIDNLTAWGDQLFRRDTLESINEATQLYVLAADILGPRPEVIERNLRPAVATFNTLGAVSALGNALEHIELLIPDAGQTNSNPGSSQNPDPPSDTVLYFGVPENDRLLAAWSTIGDRLFKIRHCMNIEGQARQLPLFESPIDPALLVRAQAAGLSIGDVLADVFPSLSNYRFTLVLQKASELVAEVRNLGALLLSALEKRDAETLSTLRSGQELRLLELVRDVRAKQVDEANVNIAALQASRELAQARKDYYEGRDFMSLLEKTALGLSTAAQIPLGAKAASEALSVVINLLPDAKAGAPTTVGVQFGGSNKGGSSGAFERWKETIAVLLNMGATIANRVAEYSRRQDEWDHQAHLAIIELKQIDQQLTAAQIRLDVAERELRKHDQQVDNAREADEFLRGKFTNQDLFQWTVGQVSGLYFQTYQLAYKLAKRAELCMQHELGLKYGETSIIRFGYWDSLKKGLLAGDQLALDVKRLDLAYLDGNVREYEMTKHVSLISLAPEQLIALKETGACEFDIPEWLFDLDTPGHYRRRVRMVSITIPCVTGPYTTVHCKARLIRNSYRQVPALAVGYERVPDDDPSGPDGRFIDDRKILEGIVTSTGQNDAGLFEAAMRDERYLPFDGAGVISRWRLELPMEFRTFDYGTISDVILHLRYTARDGGDPLRAAATTSVTTLLGSATAPPLFRLFSLRHEFPAEWHRFVSSPSSANNTMTIDLAATRFPYFVQIRGITIAAAHAIARSRSPGPIQVAVAPGQAAPDLAQQTWTGQDAPGPWTLGTASDPRLLEDLFIVLAYSAS